MTVQQLAGRLGITPREVVALCVVAGVRVTGPQQVLTEAEVAAVQRVLAGEQEMVVPKGGRPTPAGPRVPQDRIKKRRAWPWVVGTLVIGVVALAVVAGSALGGSPSITVQAGDCFDASLLGGSVFGTSIEPEPCDGATYRAVAVLDLDEVWTEWPGTEAVEARARDRCPALVQGVLDPTDYSQVYYFGPGQETAWEQASARKIVCAVKA